MEAIHLRASTGRHALLLRATLEDRAAESFRAPPRATLVFGDARNPSSSRVLTATSGTPWLYASHVGEAGVAEVRLEAGGIAARVAIPRPSAVVSPPRAVGGDLLVGVLEGTLVPGVEGTAVFSSRDEVAEWRVEPVFDTTHARNAMQTRSMGLVRMRVEGMGAPVTLVRRAFDGTERRDAVRVPVSSVGVAVEAPLPAFAAPERVTLRAAVPGAVHAVWGDDLGACGWTATPLALDGASASGGLSLPTERPCAASWIEATADATLGQRSGRRLTQATEALRVPGHPDIFAAWPSPPTPTLVFDGARRAEARLDAALRRARAMALGALAFCIVLEAAIMLHASARRSPEALVAVEHSPRTRVGALAAGLALMVVIGLVMALGALLRP